MPVTRSASTSPFNADRGVRSQIGTLPHAVCWREHRDTVLGRQATQRHHLRSGANRQRSLRSLGPLRQGHRGRLLAKTCPRQPFYPGGAKDASRPWANAVRASVCSPGLRAVTSDARTCLRKSATASSFLISLRPNGANGSRIATLCVTHAGHHPGLCQRQIRSLCQAQCFEGYSTGVASKLVRPLQGSFRQKTRTELCPRA